MGLINQTDHVPYQLLVLTAALMDEEAKLLLSTARHRAVLHIYYVVCARVLVHQADQIRPPPSETARGQAGRVAQVLDGGEDAGPVDSRTISLCGRRVTLAPLPFLSSCSNRSVADHARS